VSFVQQDVLQAKIDRATVLTLYLLPGMMQSLQTKLSRELKPGTRIVSHDFPFSDWKPDRETSVDVEEKYGTPGQWKSTLFYWIVPAQVQGQWRIESPSLAAQPLPVTLEQQFQYVAGRASAQGREVSLAGGKLEADRIQFKLTLPQGVYEFQGVVNGERMRGEVVHAGRSAAWTAVRAASPTASR
jgi:hypothetical protein